MRAAESKKATAMRVLDLREVTTMADFFVICTGANPRQIQTVAEEIGAQLAKHGEHALSVEGMRSAEWVLLDYGDLVVHVFSEAARAYYGLDRLWRHAREVPLP